MLCKLCSLVIMGHDQLTTITTLLALFISTCLWNWLRKVFMFFGSFRSVCFPILDTFLLVGAVVVTAVTELGSGKPKFYPTPDIIAFCRKWRLPTNHIWLFSTR